MATGNRSMKISSDRIFYKNLIKDWGRDDVYGPWTKHKDDGKIPFYKSYYMITDNKQPNIDLFKETKEQK